jgi:predicted transcriptional regulator
MRIVRSYVRHHQIASEQLIELIGTVHRVLASLGQAALSVAVPIQQSVRPEWCASSVAFVPIVSAGICDLIIR